MEEMKYAGVVAEFESEDNWIKLKFKKNWFGVNIFSPEDDWKVVEIIERILALAVEADNLKKEITEELSFTTENAIIDRGIP